VTLLAIINIKKIKLIADGVKLPHNNVMVKVVVACFPASIIGVNGKRDVIIIQDQIVDI